MKGWVAGPSLRDDLPEPSGSIVAVKGTSVNAIDLSASGIPTSTRGSWAGSAR
jgi:hypothetical protein